jgi:hypothetical protein
MTCLRLLKYLEDKFKEPVVVDNGANLDSTDVLDVLGRKRRDLSVTTRRSGGSQGSHSRTIAAGHPASNQPGLLPTTYEEPAVAAKVRAALLLRSQQGRTGSIERTADFSLVRSAKPPAKVAPSC